jgi:hypothetical protein
MSWTMCVRSGDVHRVYSVFLALNGDRWHRDGDRFIDRLSGEVRARRGWMVPVQDGGEWRELFICVVVSMRRAFGGCLGTRRR